jgi:microcystin-dependent protein
MSEPFIGEIRMFGGNFAPRGWAFCNGQSMSIAQNDALFALIGTTYGGDGVQTFNLPDLQGRLPLHQGTSTAGTTYVIGEKGGVETVTLLSTQTPAHTHVVTATAIDAEGSDPAGGVLAQGSGFPVYGAPNPDKPATFNQAAVGLAGGSQPHDNLQPYLCVSFIIALEGIFPQRG